MTGFWYSGPTKPVTDRRSTLSRIQSVRAICGLALLLLGLLPSAAQPLPAGTSQFEFSAGEKTLEVATYRPASYTNGPLLIVIHGMNRNAGDYRNNAMTLSDRLNVLVVAPGFDTNQFASESFQRGGITRRGKVQPQEQWTFALIPKLVEEVRRLEARPDLPYYLIGHSAGGQFLTRLASFLPGEAQRIIAGNPGSSLFPTREFSFPYGFSSLPEEVGGDEAIKRYLAAPLTLLLGEADTGSRNLDVTPTAMKQGDTRIERGRTCFRLAEELGRERGWPFHWQKIEVPGIGHNSNQLFSDPRTLRAFAPTAAPAGPPKKSGDAWERK